MNTPHEDPVLEALGRELARICRERGVGGALVLISKESASWTTVVPQWCGLKIEGGQAHVQISSKQPEHADRTLAFITSVRDMCGDYALQFGAIFDMVKHHLDRAGAVIEHEPLDDRGPSGRVRH